MVRNNQHLRAYEGKGRTLALDPQETIWLGLPFREYIYPGEPRFHRPIIGFDDTFRFDIVISGWVWRRQPCRPHTVPFLLDHPALCKDSVSATNERGTTESRTLIILYTSLHFLDG